mmetsp:Transcript_28897/g.32103  ORF Transcript_28897/g.32103 Transcript_28897/m.32103 type:complete len:141 (+) Transcript_28897:88-510(+)
MATETLSPSNSPSLAHNVPPIGHNSPVLIGGSGNDQSNTASETADNKANELQTKHPLQHSWTLWYDGPGKPKGGDWLDSVHKVMTFDTVEDFWRIWNNIRPASKLERKSTYHLFKEGVKPMWEDPTNEKVRLSKKGNGRI